MEQTHRYPLDQLVFNFVPEALPQPDIAGVNVDRTTANDLYRQAHRMVYNEWPKHDLGEKWQNAVANAKLAQMDFKTFCLYIIVGFSITHKETKFFASNLTASSSIGKIEGYRKECLRKFGASDARSLGLMLNVEFHDIDEEMLLSEINFGRRVCGNMMFTGKSNVPSIYDMDEIAFSPYWLAIEQTYYDLVFKPWQESEFTMTHEERDKLTTEAKSKWRNLVAQVRGVLQRRTHLSSTIFAARSRVMPKAVKAVLDLHGMKNTTPISDTVNVDDAFEFWQQLGYQLKVKRNGTNTV